MIVLLLVLVLVLVPVPVPLLVLSLHTMLPKAKARALASHSLIPRAPVVSRLLVEIAEVTVGTASDEANELAGE